MAKDKTRINLVLPYLKKIFLKRKFTALIDLTDQCNLNCKHCYHRQLIREEDNVSKREWKRRFLEYRRQGIRLAIFVGGEPTLRYGLLELAERYFDFLSVCTNGQVRIPQHFQRRIFLSLDGLEEEHDAVRGPGTFKRAVNNYKGDSRVVAVCKLSRQNYGGTGKLETFLDYVRQMKIGGIHISYFVPQSTVSEDYNSVLSEESCREIRSVLQKELKRKDSVLFATPRLLREQAKPLPSDEPCWLKNNAISYTSDNRVKKCPGEFCDCRYCRSWERYVIPWYSLIDILRDKTIRQKYSFKV